jgi:hypothetical protein
VNGLSGHRQEIGDQAPALCGEIYSESPKNGRSKEDVNGEEKKCRDETRKQFGASLVSRGL